MRTQPLTGKTGHLGEDTVGAETRGNMQRDKGILKPSSGSHRDVSMAYKSCLKIIDKVKGHLRV